jgi:hypothetical protein
VVAVAGPGYILDANMLAYPRTHQDPPLYFYFGCVVSATFDNTNIAVKFEVDTSHEVTTDRAPASIE